MIPVAELDDGTLVVNVVPFFQGIVRVCVSAISHNSALNQVRRTGQTVYNERTTETVDVLRREVPATQPLEDINHPYNGEREQFRCSLVLRMSPNNQRDSSPARHTGLTQKVPVCSKRGIL